MLKKGNTITIDGCYEKVSWFESFGNLLCAVGPFFALLNVLGAVVDGRHSGLVLVIIWFYILFMSVFGLYWTKWKPPCLKIYTVEEIIPPFYERT
jgi:hypothetical protein